MASLPDPLLALRQTIGAGQTPTLSATAEASSTQPSLEQANYILFAQPDGQNVAYPLDTPTRFVSNDTPIDLRSIYFAWLNKDASAPDYIAFSQQFNEQLSAPGAAGQPVKNLVFAERLDLNSWLGGLQDDSEYITSFAAAQAVQAPSPSAAAAAATSTVAEQRARAPDARLLEIYQGERRTLDRASVLHGIKPTDFSHVRKHAAAFLGRGKGGKSAVAAAAAAAAVPTPALVVASARKPNRRPEPIILLSPSASALLRMSNVKKFLEDGQYVPADSTTEETRLHLSRNMPSIDSRRPMRFVLVESTDRFKPEDWSQLVAVFTTGQMWQFKSYKWSTPMELFSRALGLYVGWSGEAIPDAIKGWGRAVKSSSIDKWNAARGEAGRWRDREAVEGIWTAIEESMRAKGWNKDSGGR
jgi:parafibromin